MRKSLALLVATASLSGVGALVPAAANAADTTVTFTVNSGSLSVNAPASLSLSAANLALTAGSVTGTMTTNTITDTRGGLGLTGWTVTGSSTDFVTANNGGFTIPKASVSLSSGAATIVSGVPVVVPSLTGVSMGAPATILQATSATGSNQVTYTPTVAVTVPTNAVPGSYSGTITQTVA